MALLLCLLFNSMFCYILDHRQIGYRYMFLSDYQLELVKGRSTVKNFLEHSMRFKVD
jgi:hypothetical protein